MPTVEDLKAPIKVFGSATYSHGDNVAVDVKCDRLAHDGNKLMSRRSRPTVAFGC